jgi:NADH-quinone oxidoreductase subunit F
MKAQTLSRRKELINLNDFKHLYKLGDLKRLQEWGMRSLFPPQTKITVGMATCGRASGAGKVFKAIQDEVKKRNLDAIVNTTGCLGICQKEPVVDVMKPGWPRIIYGEMNEQKARELIAALAEGRVITESALCKIKEEANLIDGSIRTYRIDKLPENIDKIPDYEDVPFFGKQEKRILRNCGFINPDKIEEYVAQGGYSALFIALTKLKPEEIIDQVIESGLRGRGGAGFSTGTKWKLCRQAEGSPKYIICNADEGDPGAYMDRSILEGNPQSVIEGMIIGAYAMGASKGFAYCRAEKPLAAERLRVAINQATEYGLLGDNIFDSGFSFQIEVREGAGAFVCGEETALMASIEGFAGEPHQRPPFPAQSGLWGKPTNINNVKTWANIPLIIARGPDWFSSIGTDKSKGTMVFSLVGKVKNTGLIEIPMGTTLKQIIYDIGGGIIGDKKLKAVQTGGPSGGCIPESLAHLSADYETLTKAGSIMGSGGMVVMNEDTCMVDLARYFLTFIKDESCGKCTPCREGIHQMHKILTRICDGEGREGDIELLEEMSQVIKDFSLCGLGQTAPNPVLTTIKYFRDEYEQHIKYKRCPAMVCRNVIYTPCKYNCPVRTDVPSFIAHIARKEYDAAFEVIRAPNPLPISCGYICHHPCEDRCHSRETGGESVSIKALKRFVGDYELSKGYQAKPKPAVSALEKVAIVGSGPAGLAAAFDLACLGYQPTIFEADSVPGGNLSTVIPEFRLPRQIIDKEIECITQTGVEILTNSPIGPNLTLDDLFNKGYKAILLAIGAHHGLKLGLAGEETPGVMDAFSFLKKLKIGNKVELGEKVAIVGGGNAAIDAARTALRCGSSEVSIIYRRTKVEMPAMKKEIEAGVEEGIKIVELTAPVRIISENGRLSGIECIAMGLGDFDDSGRRKPVPIGGSEFIIPLNSLILAVGEVPDLSFMPQGNGLEVSPRRTIATNPETLATARPGIFAAGDAVTGPSTIADSIAGGKQAALSIHKFLRGQPVVREYSVTAPSPYVEPVERTEEDLEMKRFPMPCAPVTERIFNFKAVELGLDEPTAIKESHRCLRCDMRKKFG